ncbi:MAG TPA: metal-sulfur cluster assembly factor [Balneolales bacterium]|nr:metal-sulfur cluster assembly factor [Balneolales bacterium]
MIQQVTPRQVAHRLKLVLDPEVGINIVDLGLVYGINCQDADVKVTVTMTSMGCPMTHYIRMSIENVLSKMQNIRNGEIELVWSPAWSPSMINPEVLPPGRGC